MIDWTDDADDSAAPEGMSVEGRDYFDLGASLVRAMGAILLPRPSLDFAEDRSAVSRFRAADGGELAA